VSKRLEKSLQSSMVYSIRDVDEITGLMSWTLREKTDELLRIDASLYANLGAEHDREDRLSVKNSSIRIYKAIKKIDPEMGGLLLRMIQDETE
jgi:hypothetical protein